MTDRRDHFLEVLKESGSRSKACAEADLEARFLRRLLDPRDRSYNEEFAERYFDVLTDVELEMEDVVLTAARGGGRSAPAHAAKYRHWIREERERWENRRLVAGASGDNQNGSSIDNAKASGGFGTLRAVSGTD